MKKSFLLVFNTCPSKAVAQKIAKSLVKEKLAACVNISTSLESIYSWKGKICQEKEYLLFIKTKASLYKKLEKRLLELHPYEVPEIIALPIQAGSSQYLEWISKETTN